MKIFFIIILLSFSAQAAEEPKGLRLSNDEVINFGVSCHDFADMILKVDSFARQYNIDLRGKCERKEGFLITKSNEILGPPFNSGGIAKFAEPGGFAEFILLIDPADYLKIENTLKASLGKPKTRNVSVVQNRMGAKFENVKTTWDTDNVLVVMEMRSSSVDQGVFTVTHKSLAKLLPNSSEVVKAPF